MSDTPVTTLIAVTLIGVAFIVARGPLARVVFGTLAYMNDPASSGQRWRRENAALEKGVRWFFGIAGGAFVLYALLDWLDIITL